MYLKFEIDTYDTIEQGLVLQAIEVIDRYRDDMNGRKVAQQTAFVDNVPPLRNQAGDVIDGQTEVPGPSPTLPPAEATVQNAPTEKECIAALRSMMDREGFPAVRKLLDSFGVQRVGELSAQQRTEFVAKATTPAEAR